MPGSYLDEIYGFGMDPEDQAMPTQGPPMDLRPGSDINPLDMEPMDVRQRIEPPAGADYPEGSRVDLGDGTERIYGPGGSFEVRPVPTATVDFGDMTPRAPMGPRPAVEKRGNVEYIYDGEPDMAGVNRPREPRRKALAGAPPAAGGPPPGVVPPRGTPAPAGQPVPDSGMSNAASPGEWNGEYYAPGEKGSQWNQFLEDPTAANGRVAKGDTARGGAQPSREDLMREDQTSPVPEDLSQIYEREFARQASLTPEQRVAENARREFERNQQGIDEMAAAAAKSRVEAQQNLDAMLSARKKSQEEIDRLKAQPGWWDRRTTGQKVALYADAAFSGMLAAFQGSNRNTAIESMQAAIEQDAEERAQEFAQARQGMVDADELFKMKELVRLRGMEEAKGMILTRMAQYDKNGSMAAAGMAAVQDLEARQADAEAKILEHNWKKELEIRKMASEEMQTAARLKQSDIESRRAAGTARRGQDMAFQASLLENSGTNPKDAADLENTRARTAAVKAEIERHDRADVIVDPGNKNWQKKATVLGRPRDFEQRKDIQSGVVAYSKLRAQLKDLIDYTKTEGQAGKLTEKRAVIDQKRKLIAQTYAKIVDSVGAVSDKTIEAAEDVIPDTDGWIKRWQYTDEIYKSLVRNADEGIETMAAAGIEDYRDGTLSRQWQDFDRQMFAPPPTREDLALERARGDSPAMYLQGSKYRKAAEEGAAERGENPSYAPVYDDSVEDPWEKARKGEK